MHSSVAVVGVPELPVTRRQTTTANTDVNRPAVDVFVIASDLFKPSLDHGSIPKRVNSMIGTDTKAPEGCH